MPSLKNTALIFLEILLIECCTVLVEPSMASSLSSFAQYKNVNISITKKDIPKRKTPFFFNLKNVSSKRQLFCFCFISTLKAFKAWSLSYSRLYRTAKHVCYSYIYTNSNCLILIIINQDYSFLDHVQLKKLPFSTNSLAKLLLDSFSLESSISQSQVGYSSFLGNCRFCGLLLLRVVQCSL